MLTTTYVTNNKFDNPGQTVKVMSLQTKGNCILFIACQSLQQEKWTTSLVFTEISRLTDNKTFFKMPFIILYFLNTLAFLNPVPIQLIIFKLFITPSYDNYDKNKTNSITDIDHKDDGTLCNVMM